MRYDDFGYPGSDSDFDSLDEYVRDGEDAERVDTEALERWLHSNHGLWRLGLHLASVARQYRREYRHVPFNNSGWFSPN
ncbi:MAG: hypothetical protein Q8N51_20100 [Gammaproteobacteria bacterium]|nr:hypothetical protein [Gammaproteobacteria bacterium]